MVPESEQGSRLQVTWNNSSSLWDDTLALTHVQNVAPIWVLLSSVFKQGSKARAPFIGRTLQSTADRKAGPDFAIDVVRTIACVRAPCGLWIHGDPDFAAHRTFTTTIVGIRRSAASSSDAAVSVCMITRRNHALIAHKGCHWESDLTSPMGRIDWILRSRASGLWASTLMF